MTNDLSAILIRPAALGDSEAVFGLLSDFAVSYPPDRAAFDRIFPELIVSDNANLLVATMDEMVVGYALAARMATLYASGDVWNLQEIMVNAEHRGRGIGRCLLSRVVDDARERGAVEVVVPTRHAGGFYLKCGFAETAMMYKCRVGG